MSKCYLRENESDVRDFAKYDGTLSALQAVQAILPRGWNSSYSITETGVSSFQLTRGAGQATLCKDQVTYVVVDRFGTLELHDSTSFQFLFSEDPNRFHFDIMADDGFLWGG